MWRTWRILVSGFIGVVAVVACGERSLTGAVGGVPTPPTWKVAASPTPTIGTVLTGVEANEALVKQARARAAFDGGLMLRQLEARQASGTVTAAGGTGYASLASEPEIGYETTVIISKAGTDATAPYTSHGYPEASVGAYVVYAYGRMARHLINVSVTQDDKTTNLEPIEAEGVGTRRCPQDMDTLECDVAYPPVYRTYETFAPVSNMKPCSSTLEANTRHSVTNLRYDYARWADGSSITYEQSFATPSVSPRCEPPPPPPEPDENECDDEDMDPDNNCDDYEGETCYYCELWWYFQYGDFWYEWDCEEVDPENCGEVED